MPQTVAAHRAHEKGLGSFPPATHHQTGVPSGSCCPNGLAGRLAVAVVAMAPCRGIFAKRLVDFWSAAFSRASLGNTCVSKLCSVLAISAQILVERLVYVLTTHFLSHIILAFRGWSATRRNHRMMQLTDQDSTTMHPPPPANRREKASSFAGMPKSDGPLEVPE